jgi:hypothetical protein
MRLLVNENVSSTVIQQLRQWGHDVLSVKESFLCCHRRSNSDAVVAQSGAPGERGVMR